MELTKITIGCDPEVFVALPNGEVVSGIGLLGGTKKEPLPITPHGHSIQEDNVAWEFNIPPSSTAEEYVENINFVLGYLRHEADKHGLVLSELASYELDEKYLNNKQAKRFGCEPDFNVYTGTTNKRPSNKTNLRVTGRMTA